MKKITRIQHACREINKRKKISNVSKSTLVWKSTTSRENNNARRKINNVPRNINNAHRKINTLRREVDKDPNPNPNHVPKGAPSLHPTLKVV